MALVAKVYKSLQRRLPRTVAFRGLVFASGPDLDTYLSSIATTGLTNVASHSLQCKPAAGFADPQRTIASVHSFLLTKSAYPVFHSDSNQREGLLCILDGYEPLDLTGLQTQSAHEAEVWIRDPRAHVHW